VPRSSFAVVIISRRRQTLRVKPNTIYFLAYEVRGRFERVQADRQRLFELTRRPA
jgi:hypothetical protein